MNDSKANYSPEELNGFRATFAATLKQYRATERRYSLPIFVLIIAGFAVVACSYVLFQQPQKWLIGIGLFLIGGGLIAIVLAASVLQKNLLCPACHNVFVDGIQECCPECGSAPLEPANWLGAHHCNACGKNLMIGKNRNFKYKACSHCGVFLDEKGL